MNDKWKNAVIYQIYPRSFQDSNGDGIGDLNGITMRLDYLKELGIDAIWLSPVCKSPQDDNGYDISDYQDIDPMFGTLEDMDRLISEAKKRGIGILMDLVLNHSSDEHRWFIEAKKDKESPYHDYYVWRDGVEDVPPNALKSAFGGSGWEWVPEIGQYYMHLFSKKQPDLNWENEELRREIYDMILWWMDRGVAGFRLDVIDCIGKEPDKMITENGAKLHTFIQEMSRETFAKGDLITVGETWGATVDTAKLYSNPDGSEFSMIFQFEHIVIDQKEGGSKWDLAPFSLVKLKQVFEKWETGLYQTGWNSLFWDNHDLPRIVSRWGNDSTEYRELSAKMLAVVLHGMQGTPYIYEGEELGMTNTAFSLEELNDIEGKNAYKEMREAGRTHEDALHSIHVKGRDNARTPMHWDDSLYAGFSTAKPWIKQNENYTFINAKEQMGRADSVFHFYKKLIALRKRYEVFADGNFTLYEKEHEQLVLYSRETAKEKLLIIANFSADTIPFVLPKGFEDGQVLLHNYPERESGMLRPYEAMILYYADPDAEFCGTTVVV